MTTKFDYYEIQEEQIKEFWEKKSLKKSPNLFLKIYLNEIIECILHNQETAWKKYMVYHENIWRWKINEGVKNPKPKHSVAISSADLSVLMFRERSRRHCGPLGRCLCNVVVWV